MRKRIDLNLELQPYEHFHFLIVSIVYKNYNVETILFFPKQTIFANNWRIFNYEY